MVQNGWHLKVIDSKKSRWWFLWGGEIRVRRIRQGLEMLVKVKLEVNPK